MSEQTQHRPFIIECRLVPLDRATGKPIAERDDLPTQVNIDIEALTSAMLRAKFPECSATDVVPIREIKIHAAVAAQALGEMFAADVYYRAWVPPCSGFAPQPWVFEKCYWQPGMGSHAQLEEMQKALAELKVELAELKANNEKWRELLRFSCSSIEDCGHSIAEHEAFDAGVRDGETGTATECDESEYGAPELDEAWRTGVAVGVLNRGASSGTN